MAVHATSSIAMAQQPTMTQQQLAAALCALMVAIQWSTTVVALLQTENCHVVYYSELSSSTWSSTDSIGRLHVRGEASPVLDQPMELMEYPALAAFGDELC